MNYIFGANVRLNAVLITSACSLFLSLQALIPYIFRIMLNILFSPSHTVYLCISVMESTRHTVRYLTQISSLYAADSATILDVNWPPVNGDNLCRGYAIKRKALSGAIIFETHNGA